MQLKSKFPIPIKRFTRILVASTLMLAQGCDNFAGMGGADSGYKIVLSRPFEVGFKSVEHITGEYELYDGAYLNGNTIEEKTESARVDLVVDAEVLTTDVKGQATGMRYTLRSIRPHPGTTVPPSLVPGTVIEVSASSTDKTHSGIPDDIEDALRGLLEVMLSAGRPNRATEDEYMGTKKRVEIGDTWPLNLEEVRRDMTSASIPLTGATLSGFAKLEAVRDVDGVRCLIVYAEVRAEGIQLSIPAGTRIEKATLFGSDLFTVPEDPALPMKSYVSNVSFNLQLKANNGVAVYRTLTSSITTTFE